EAGFLIIEDFCDRMIGEVGYLSGFSIDLFPVSDKTGLYHSLGLISKSCIDGLSEKPWFTEPAKKFCKTAPHALIHCDLWPNNILYKNVGEDVRLLAVIDWQCVTVGNTLFDISLLCALCLTPEVRRANEKELVEKI
ncbi:hypothetical protein PENTCL1PPCAC_14798, partial [Pristionchus entomophagus]